MCPYKDIHFKNYPVQLEKNEEHRQQNARELRPTSIRLWREDGKTSVARESFTRSTAKIWNQAPTAIREAANLAQAKKLIKKYCSTLPI